MVHEAQLPLHKIHCFPGHTKKLKTHTTVNGVSIQCALHRLKWHAKQRTTAKLIPYGEIITPDHNRENIYCARSKLLYRYIKFSSFIPHECINSIFKVSKSGLDKFRPVLQFFHLIWSIYICTCVM